MQLTTISQCKAGMNVFHPLYGDGYITDKYGDKDSKQYIRVKFPNPQGGKHYHDYFWDNPGAYGENSIYHLHTEPIQVVTKDQFDTMAGIIEYFASRYDENYMDDQIGRDMISMAQQLLIEIKPETK